MPFRSSPMMASDEESTMAASIPSRSAAVQRLRVALLAKCAAPELASSEGRINLLIALAAHDESLSSVGFYQPSITRQETLLRRIPRRLIVVYSGNKLNSPVFHQHLSAA